MIFLNNLDQVWWTACKLTPYLIKGGIYDNKYIIGSKSINCITNHVKVISNLK